jgi:hypothetical protein
MLQPFLTNIKKIADNAQSGTGGSFINMQNVNVNQQLPFNSGQAGSQFRPPAPLPHANNDWSQISEGFSYAFNSKIPVEMKELYGELGFDTIQAKYEVAALQLQNMETMKMLKDKENV